MNTKAPSPAEQAFMDTMNALTQRWEEVEVRLQATLGAVKLRGALAQPVGTGGTNRPATANGSLLGWSLRNTGATAATVILRAGRDTGGAVIASIQLNVGESTRDWFGPGGVSYADGLFVDLTGTIEGAVYLRSGE